MKTINKMKKYILLITVSFLLLQNGYSQTFMEIEENKLLLGGKPTVPNMSPIPYTLLDSIFSVIQKEEIEYRYVNGSCEDRAHYISLLFKKMNISSGKIWNFAPARITLISNELFKVKDPYSISDTVVTWGYHVAPVITAKNEEGQIDTLVLDQSFSPTSFIRYKDWLKVMNCTRSVYTFTDTDSYLFNSLNGLTVYNNNENPAPSHNMPNFLPQIITGDFWQLDPTNDYVQTGLAINDLSYYMAIAADSDKYTDSEKAYLLNLIKNIDKVELFTKSSRPNELSKDTYKSLIDYYKSRINHWDTKYSLLK